MHSREDTVKRMKRQATDWEKIFAKHITNKRLVFKIINDSLKLNNMKVNNNLKMDKRYEEIPSDKYQKR